MRRAKHSFAQTWPLAVAVWRQTTHILACKLAKFRYRASAPAAQINFWPEKPHPYSTAYRALHLLGVDIVRSLPTKAEDGIGFLWKDATFLNPPANAHGLINGNCLDISKTRVEAIHLEVFGYSLGVDPLNYVGKIVIKSDLNATHDGVEAVAPLTEKHPGVVYQRLGENRPPNDSPDKLCDYRVPIFWTRPTFAYLKIRPQTARFSNANTNVTLVEEAAALFSPEEMRLLTIFCRRTGLDYGEIDVVRDHETSLIYVLDINKTPLGPPNGLSKADHVHALRLYRKHFAAMIEIWPQRLIRA
jgi:hypothetical protein